MQFNLSGLRLSVSEPQRLPSAFRDSLLVFRQADGGTPDLSLGVAIGTPGGDRCAFSSNLVEILHTAEGAELFRFSDGKAKCALRFLSSAGCMTLFLYPGQPDDEELAEQARVLVRLATEEFAASCGRVSLHASVFVRSGAAVCVTGPSGAGKSTLTRNWLGAFPASFVLNGDRPMLRATEAGAVVFGVPWSGTEQIYVNDSAPLAAVVEVRKYPRNRVFRLTCEDALRLFLGRVSKPLWSRQAASETVSTIGQLAAAVPVYRLYCVNDGSAALCLDEVLSGRVQAPLLRKGDRILKIKKNFVLRKILDDYMVVPVGSDSAAADGAILLDGVGAFVWEKLQAPATRDDLLAMLLEEYDEEPETAEKDLDEFLDTLRHYRVLDED